MAGMNGAMAPGIDTVFLPASPEVRHITGTLVRQIALMGGNVSAIRVTRRGAPPQGQGRQKEGVSVAFWLERAPHKGHKAGVIRRPAPWNLEKAAAFPNSSWSPPP